jgi:ABC-type dipeptide/oligopeptide/nickel transport system permease subunit
MTVIGYLQLEGLFKRKIARDIGMSAEEFVAGYFGGWIDTICSRIIDTFLAIPFILLAISLVTILGPSLRNIFLVIVLYTWIVYARVVRGEVLSLKEHEFVVGVRAARRCA